MNRNYKLKSNLSICLPTAYSFLTLCFPVETNVEFDFLFLNGISIVVDLKG